MEHGGIFLRPEVIVVFSAKDDVVSLRGVLG